MSSENQKKVLTDDLQNYMDDYMDNVRHFKP